MSSVLPAFAAWLDRVLPERRAFVLLTACLALFTVMKFVVIGQFISKGESIFDLGFGFGGYIKTLVQHGQYAECLAPSCDKASRLPLMPALYAALSYITSSQRGVAYLKAALLSVLFLVSFAGLIRIGRRTSGHIVQSWSLVGAVLFLSPVVIKHAAAITYEEGILIELVILWIFSFFLVVAALASDGGRKPSSGLMIATMTLAIAAYLTKSSMIVLAFLSMAAAGVSLWRYRDRAAAGGIAACLACMLAWGLHCAEPSGRFTLMTSWDAPNEYRGWSAEGAQIYPEVTLDRLFLKPSVVYLESGKAVPLPQIPDTSSFPNEWAASDYYHAKSVAWGTAHPAEAAMFTLKKIYVFFIGIRKTPYSYSNDARQKSESASTRLISSLWLLAGRILEALLLAMVWLLWRQGDAKARALAIATLLVTGSYAAPYIAGYSFERHISLFLIIVAVCCAVLGAEVLDRAVDGRLGKSRSRSVVQASTASA